MQTVNIMGSVAITLTQQIVRNTATLVPLQSKLEQYSKDRQQPTKKLLYKPQLHQSINTNDS